MDMKLRSRRSLKVAGKIMLVTLVRFVVLAVVLFILLNITITGYLSQRVADMNILEFMQLQISITFSVLMAHTVSDGIARSVSRII